MHALTYDKRLVESHALGSSLQCRPCDVNCIESDSHTAIYTTYNVEQCQSSGEFYPYNSNLYRN